MDNQRTLPLLPLRDIVIFPAMVIPLFVGRPRSIAALDNAMAAGRELILATQKNARTDDPAAADIHEIGTLGHIVQILRMPDATIKVLVEGRERVRIEKFIQHDPHFQVAYEPIAEQPFDPREAEALVREVQQAVSELAKLSNKLAPEVLMALSALEDPSRLADQLVQHLSLKIKDRQAILEMSSPVDRLEKLLELIQSEAEILAVEKKIRHRVRKQMEKSQREYYLNEQMQAIQRELGDKDEFRTEIAELEERIEKKKMSPEARERSQKELKKLKMMAPMSAEATVVRNYIDWILALPWEEYTKERLDIQEASAILEEDHYGLEKAKSRILEYLAVQGLVKKLKGPILCLVGPPGVGKTSLARSLARSTGREYIRISLGGVRDEAEIRGHRRTYIGALPGKIIQSLRKVKSNNPVFLLDEVDKMSADFRGDPAAALLEVLDPEQNNTFNDHYLDLDYDLSQVMFITTANYREGIPVPLQDRMEIIELPGYTEFDKSQIAQKFLVPRQKEANGLTKIHLDITAPAITTLIRNYTKEAGVRSLEREVASICRKVAKQYISDGKPKSAKYRITPATVVQYLGAHRFTYGRTEENDAVGVVNGLAVTAVGGDLLTVEATVVPAAQVGSGKLMITGSVKKVMEESGQAALTYVRSRAEILGIEADTFSKVDIHVHIPEGAIPKDGPSAGITMATAIASALTHIPARATVAMTGEITLRGRVLPIGGVKEKLIAAHRGGIQRIIVPKENEKDLKDVPKTVLKTLTVHLAEHMDEVLENALAAPAGTLFGKKQGSAGKKSRSKQAPST